MDAGLLVAREGELEAIRALLRGDGADARALVLEGDPGVGKTSLWEHGVAWAREDGRRVLVARASEDEGGLPFAGLIDLFDGVTSEELGAVPAPQVRALEVALYRADPTDRPPEAQVISLAVLSALRALARATRCWSRSTTSSGWTARRRRRSRTPPAGCTPNPSRSCWPADRAGVRRSRRRSPTSSSSASSSAPSAWARPARSWPPGSGCGCRTTCCGGSTRRRWATRCSRSRSGGCWPVATSTPSATTCPSPTTSRTCWACGSPTWTTRRAGCCWRSPSTPTCASRS